MKINGSMTRMDIGNQTGLPIGELALTATHVIGCTR